MVKPFPLFLDSPMAIEATEVYKHHHELFDDQMLDYIEERPIWEDLQTLKMTETADESRAINAQDGPCLIMAGAGMCNAGRILHHLRNNVYKPETHVLIVGYQGDGSLGRQLVQGAKEVRIFGEKVAVRAQVHTLNGFSAHAGQCDLLDWFSAIAPSKPRVVLTHGEDGPRSALAGVIQERHGLTATLPKLGEVIEL
jgi:metallo-beta-lactamase family protein